MMRKVLYILFLNGTLSLLAKGNEEVRWEVEGQVYIIRTTFISNDLCCNGKDIKFLLVFREEGDRLIRLLAFPLFRSYRDGHYEQVELGKYRIEGNKLLLFTWWNSTGQDNVAPVGAKKMQYEVREDGKLYWKSGLIYLETGYRSEGARFLKKPITNPKERVKFESYIRSVEKEHLAKFVFGITSDKLCAEIRKELAKEIKAVKAEWYNNPYP